MTPNDNEIVRFFHSSSVFCTSRFITIRHRCTFFHLFFSHPLHDSSFIEKFSFFAHCFYITEHRRSILLTSTSKFGVLFMKEHEEVKRTCQINEWNEKSKNDRLQFSAICKWNCRGEKMGYFFSLFMHGWRLDDEFVDLFVCIYCRNWISRHIVNTAGQPIFQRMRSGPNNWLRIATKWRNCWIEIEFVHAKSASIVYEL